MAREVVLEIPARREYLQLAREVIEAAASTEPTFQDDRIYDLRVAVSEAVTNAIRAHADLDGEQHVTIRCNLAEDRIEVEVQDHGRGFEVDNMPAIPDMTDPARLEIEGGFGIPLMRTLTDETEIRSSADGTAVRLAVFQRRPTGA